MPVGLSDGSTFDTHFDMLVSPSTRIDNAFRDVSDAFQSGQMDAQGENYHPAFESNVPAKQARLDSSEPALNKQVADDMEQLSTSPKAKVTVNPVSDFIYRNVPGAKALVDYHEAKYGKNPQFEWADLIGNLMFSMNLLGSGVKPIPKPNVKLPPGEFFNPGRARSDAAALEDRRVVQLKGENAEPGQEANDNNLNIKARTIITGPGEDTVVKTGSTLYRGKAIENKQYASDNDAQSLSGYDKAVSAQIKRNELKAIEGGNQPTPMEMQQQETRQLDIPKLKKMYESTDLSLSDIEAREGLSQNTLAKVFKREGIPTDKFQVRADQETVQRVARGRNEGKTYQAIADELGITRERVAGIIARHLKGVATGAVATAVATESEAGDSNKPLSTVERTFLKALDLYEQSGFASTRVKLYNDIVQRGRTKPITEKDLSPTEVNQLKDLVKFKIKQTGENVGKIDYKDYYNHTAARSFKDQWDNPTFTTDILGGFSYSKDDKGTIHIKDTYDFNTGGKFTEYDDNQLLQALAVLGDPYHLAAAIGRKVIPDKSGKGVPVKIKLEE